MYCYKSAIKQITKIKSQSEKRGNQNKKSKSQRSITAYIGFSARVRTSPRDISLVSQAKETKHGRIKENGRIGSKSEANKQRMARSRGTKSSVAISVQHRKMAAKRVW